MRKRKSVTWEEGKKGGTQTESEKDRQKTEKYAVF